MIESLGYNKFDFPLFAKNWIKLNHTKPNRTETDCIEFISIESKCVNIILFQRISCAWIPLINYLLNLTHLTSSDTLHLLHIIHLIWYWHFLNKWIPNELGPFRFRSFSFWISFRFCLRHFAAFIFFFRILIEEIDDTHLQIVDHLLLIHTIRPNCAYLYNGRLAISYQMVHSSFEHLDCDKVESLHMDLPYWNCFLKHLAN